MQSCPVDHYYHCPCPVGHMVVPRLYFVPESELTDDGTGTGSMVTFKDLLYNMEPMMEDIPFQCMGTISLSHHKASQ